MKFSQPGSSHSLHCLKIGIPAGFQIHLTDAYLCDELIDITVDIRPEGGNTQGGEQQQAIGQSGDVYGSFWTMGAFLTVGLIQLCRQIRHILMNQILQRNQDTLSAILGQVAHPDARLEEHIGIFAGSQYQVHLLSLVCGQDTVKESSCTIDGHSDGDVAYGWLRIQ